MINLKRGDCIQLMEQLEDESVDMILCDLPQGKKYPNGKIQDTGISSDELWKEYRRVIKDRGVIVMLTNEPYASYMRVENIDLYKYDWVYEKSQATNFFHAKTGPMYAWSTASVFYKKAPKFNPQVRKGFKPYKTFQQSKSSNYDWRTNRYTVQEDKKGERHPINLLGKFRKPKGGHHKQQKSVEMLEYFIRSYTDEGQVVLDNTMGSGSTGVACVNTNRSFIGFEINEGYFDVAKERIANAEDLLAV